MKNDVQFRRTDQFHYCQKNQKSLKNYLEKTQADNTRKQLNPTHQFGFRSRHSTIEQVHEITKAIVKSLEENKLCTSVFLDVVQAFDKVRYKGLKEKLSNMLSNTCTEILVSCIIENRHFRVKFENSYTASNRSKLEFPKAVCIESCPLLSL